MTRISRRVAVKSLGASAAALGLMPSFTIESFGQNQPTKVKFTLPWIPHGAYSAFIVAKEAGLWKDRGLDVSVSRGFGSADANKRIGLGEFDYGDASFSVTLQTIAQGMDLVGLGLHMQVSPLGIFSLKKNNIKNPKDLEGKTIGATPTTGDFHIFPAFAAATGLDQSKIKFKFLQGNVRAQTLIEGGIDALTGYYSTDAAPLWVEGAEIDIMLYHKYGVRLYDTGMVALRSQIEKFPEVTQALVEGAMEGLKYTYLKPDDSLKMHIASMKEFQGSDKTRETMKHQMAINTALGIHPGPRKNGLGWYIPEEVEENVKVANKYLKLQKEIKAEGTYTNKFLGKTKLADAEWAAVEKGIKSYVIW